MIWDCASQEVLSKTQLVSFQSYYPLIENSSPWLSSLQHYVGSLLTIRVHKNRHM